MLLLPSFLALLACAGEPRAAGARSAARWRLLRSALGRDRVLGAAGADPDGPAQQGGARILSAGASPGTGSNATAKRGLGRALRARRHARCRRALGGGGVLIAPDLLPWLRPVLAGLLRRSRSQRSRAAPDLGLGRAPARLVPHPRGTSPPPERAGMAVPRRAARPRALRPPRRADARPPSAALPRRLRLPLTLIR